MRAAVICSAVLLLALPSSAAAGGAAPWFGQYRVTLSGSQHVDWTLNHPDGGPCDPAQTGSGSEQVDLHGGAAIVTAHGAPGLVVVDPLDEMQLGAVVTRNGSVTVAPPSGDTTGCPGGGDDATPTPPPDCGTKTSAQRLSLITPDLTGVRVDASALSDPGPALFGNCPVNGTAFPAVVAATAPLDARLFGLDGAPLVHAQAVGTVPLADADVTGSQRAEYTLQFTRLFAVPLVSVPSSAKAVPVDARGAAVPLGCPRGGPACTGTLSLGLGGNAAETRGFRATAGTSPFPAPVVHSEPVLGSVRVRLRAGQRRTVRVRAPQFTGAARRALNGVDVDVILRFANGRRSLRYVAASLPVKAR